jgi:hypothetical protein
MKGLNRKGIIFSNAIYLILFYIIYFPLVMVALYFKDQIYAVYPFSDYVASIPSYTTALMNIIIFIVVPLAALAYALMSSRPEQQVMYQ